ncbi:MAG: hypothetical protein KF799_13515 [Bdellovibrionales bacterium]|nr:hypothetical protein [Bdellovibrionales bacterium]
MKLNYVINKPRADITLNLFEAERYEPAIIIQSLIGNLVYHSNHGRYEPRLVKKWQRIQPNIWQFELLPGLVAENGEAITAQSFKASIERSLRFLSRSGPFPVFMNLRGYSEFVKGDSKALGLRAEGDLLTFEFDQPVRDGLLQVLSFAPFGYISADNLNADGSWKDNSKFISSGPYRVSEIKIGERYVLNRRLNWAGEFIKGAPETLEFTHTIPQSVGDMDLWIIDAFTSSVAVPAPLDRYPLVPEYINPILLGNLKKGYFANRNVRVKLKALIAKHREQLPPSWGAHTRSEHFYPNQADSTSVPSELTAGAFPKPKDALLIEGKEPSGETPSAYAWQVLKAALNEAGLSYKFANNETNMKHLSDQSYDIRLRGASAGGGAEAWGLKILFCSELGPKLPDPSGQVCHWIESYEAERVSEQDFSKGFLKAVEEDASIIPISHYGIQLYLSPRIVRESLNPTLSIMRFDRLETL